MGSIFVGIFVLILVDKDRGKDRDKDQVVTEHRDGCDEVMHEKGITQDGAIPTPDLGAVKQTVGSLDGEGLTFGIVVSRFNESLTQALCTTAVDCLKEHGVAESAIEVFWVPGAFEVPSVVQKIAKARKHSAIIALGVVVKGETPHAELINTEVARGLGQIAREFDIPVIHEVVGTNNMEQAVARCTSGPESRGWYAALAAIEMARVWESM